MNRWVGLLTFGAMLIANVSVFTRDIVPEWWAGDPPPTDASTLTTELPERSVQVGIFNSSGQRIGSGWTMAKRSNDVVTVNSITLLGPITLPGVTDTRALRIDTEITYQNRDARIDSLSLKVSGLPVPIEIQGQSLPSDQFPLAYTIGDTRGTFVLPGGATRAMRDVVRPFDRMRDLYVGQTWRLKLIDPLAHLLNPDSEAEEVRFDSIVVRVTEKTTLNHAGMPVECLIVDAGRMKAWVGEDDGRVLRQEIQLPLFGKLALIDEPFVRSEYQRVQQKLEHAGLPRRGPPPPGVETAPRAPARQDEPPVSSTAPANPPAPTAPPEEP